MANFQNVCSVTWKNQHWYNNLPLQKTNKSKPLGLSCYIKINIVNIHKYKYQQQAQSWLLPIGQCPMTPQTPVWQHQYFQKISIDTICFQYCMKIITQITRKHPSARLLSCDHSERLLRKTAAAPPDHQRKVQSEQWWRWQHL